MTVDADATAIFRVAQESLTNVARHAGVSEVRILLNFSGQRIGLQIIDNDCGFNPAEARKSGSFGLTGMRERILALGGTKSIASRPGAGTTISIDIPTTGKAND
jgi:signal transduction histidine kinase